MCACIHVLTVCESIRVSVSLSVSLCIYVLCMLCLSVRLSVSLCVHVCVNVCQQCFNSYLLDIHHVSAYICSAIYRTYY